jgi:hypothetical protein
LSAQLVGGTLDSLTSLAVKWKEIEKIESGQLDMLERAKGRLP